MFKRFQGILNCTPWCRETPASQTDTSDRFCRSSLDTHLYIFYGSCAEKKEAKKFYSLIWPAALWIDIIGVPEALQNNKKKSCKIPTFSSITQKSIHQKLMFHFIRKEVTQKIITEKILKFHGVVCRVCHLFSHWILLKEWRAIVGTTFRIVMQKESCKIHT